MLKWLHLCFSHVEVITWDKINICIKQSHWLYKIVSIILIWQVQNYESYITTFGRGGKPSLISESVVETRMNIHLRYDNNSQRQSRSRSVSHLSLVHVFHMVPLQAICGWPINYPSIHHCRNGKLSSNLVTISATKFIGPHKSRMC
jgi:hypothetical protein